MARQQRADRKWFRVLLSDQSSLVQKQHAASLLSDPPLRQRLTEIVAQAPQHGFVDILLPLELREAIGEAGAAAAIEPIFAGLRRRPSNHFRFEQRGQADVDTLLKIGERAGGLAALQQRIVATVLRRQDEHLEHAELAQNTVYLLDHRGNAGTKVFDGPEVRRFLYAMLSYPDATVRAAAAHAFEGRSGPEVARALRGVGINPDYEIDVQHALLDFTVFVDHALREQPEVLAEVQRLAQSPEPRLHEPAHKVLKAIDAEQQFHRYLASLTPEQRQQLREELLRLP
jgi:hypothetical protein